MKDYRFYLEYTDNVTKRKGTVKAPGPHTGNVVAIDTSLKPYSNQGEAGYEGFAAVYFHANSAVNWGFIGLRHLEQDCRRIPEALAREIHPALFARLDD